MCLLLGGGGGGGGGGGHGFPLKKRVAISKSAPTDLLNFYIETEPSDNVTAPAVLVTWIEYLIIFGISR